VKHDKRFNLLIIFVIISFLFFVGMESIAFARAGGGRSSGSRGFSSGGTYRSAPSQPSGTYSATPTGYDSRACSSTSGSSFFWQKLAFNGIGGGLLGGMMGSMLFGAEVMQGGGGWGGGGFGFSDLLILLIIIGIIIP